MCLQCVSTCLDTAPDAANCAGCGAAGKCARCKAGWATDAKGLCLKKTKG